jgi:hypothetical protein
MKSNPSATCVGLALVALASPGHGNAACTLQSGPKATPLVELYTSEGCSSCPPADRRLGEFSSRAQDLVQVVPISLHVDYWDYIGWKEPYAQEQFGARQSWLTHVNGHKTVYTPHFFVSGIEVRDWDADLVNALRRVGSQDAQARIQLQAGAGGGAAVSVAASATAIDSAAPLGLFVAVTEDKLTSHVSAGENRGTTLTHDHVVREWIGPIPLKGGSAELQRNVTPGPGWNRGELGVAAFVEDLQTGRVLQAVAGAQCLR